MSAEIPKLIYLTGVDGSGKTLFADMLAEELRKNGYHVERIWARFTNITSKPLLALARVLKLSYYETFGTTHIGYHDFEKSKTVSRMFFFFQIIDAWLVTLYKVRWKLFAKKILICDRGVYDTYLDVITDTKNRQWLNGRVKNLFTFFLPKDHLVLCLVRKADRILASRPELRHDRCFRFRYDIYAAAAEKFSWPLIQNDGSPHETLAKLKEAIPFFHS